MSSSHPQQCPSNSFSYNTTLCACVPGYVFNNLFNNCTLFNPSPAKAWVVNSGVDYSITFPATIFSFDSIKKFTQSQAVFLEATLVLLLSWLGFCMLFRFRKVGDGRGIVFRIRWWISRLDVCFSTRHWLDDQKVVVKRKTELGGTLSIASWILFIGLFAALLYQVISKRSVEVHNVRATNAPDLASFRNDMEFNITTVSSMSCSNLRGLGTLVTGSPGFLDERVAPLSNFGNYSCHNTSSGPTISLKCDNCQIIRDNMYISWWFVDLPSNPATAVGFEFNLTAKSRFNKKHLSFVSGTLKNGSNLNDRPVTFRGADGNILKFNLFPRIYRNKHDLRLIQPLFHEFLPGSSYQDATKLQASIESFSDGLLNTTLYINFLSAYVIEIDNQKILGPVSFLADLGGLYCTSMVIFFYVLVQCEYRIKRLRNEDSVLRKIRSRRKAQDHWNKLRKYVFYTYGCSTMDDEGNKTKEGLCCNGMIVKSSHGKGSTRSRSRRQSNRKDDISFSQTVDVPSIKKVVAGQTHSHDLQSYSRGCALIPEGFSYTRDHSDKVLESMHDPGQKYPDSCEGDTTHVRPFPLADSNSFPPPPSLDFKAGHQISMSDIQKNLQSMYNYNVLLREKLIAAQSMLHAIETNASSNVKESHR